ncbi:MAG: hypothetical protein LBE27_04630 [Deltaproteobacteria bacterium]|jgi:hypothetical protein|nr:hypothetical protein [Deltaproteobacteria bacterium]
MLNNSISKIRLINLLLIPILICVYLILFSNILHAQNETMWEVEGKDGCPKKIFETRTETGVFLEHFCGESDCFVHIIRDADGKETSYLAEGKAKNFSGKSGTKISYDYEYLQTLTYVFGSVDGSCAQGYIVNSIKAIK